MTDEEPTVKIILSQGHDICGECERIIPAYTVYEEVKGVWDGEENIFHTCKDCLSVRRVFFPRSWRHEDVWGCVWESICNNYGEIPEDCYGQLTDWARGKVIDMVNDYFEMSEY